jgi:predicted transglutaminase-like cysteine proteinase
MRKLDKTIRISSFFICSFAIFSANAQSDSSSHNSYFEMNESRSDDLTSFPKWGGVLERFKGQIIDYELTCELDSYSPCLNKEWEDIFPNLRGQKFAQQLKTANDWGNAHPYIQDQVNWGVSDYWETPYEFMEISGDCEDYAIAKYYYLRALGIPAEKLRIIIVQDLNLGGIVHAILGVYTDSGELMILDNQADEVLPALNIYHYRPVYGLNEKSWWAYYPKNSEL